MPKMPRLSGWSSGNTPLAFGVVTTGHWMRSASSTSRRGPSPPRTPEPTNNRPRLDSSISSAACSIASGATERSTIDGSASAGTDSSRASVMSIGSVSATGPRGPDSAVRIALRSIAGARCGSLTSAAYLVTLRSISTMCSPYALPSCSAPRPKLRRATSPASSSTGSPSQNADVRPVIALSTPGPVVTIATPSLPDACA